MFETGADVDVFRISSTIERYRYTAVFKSSDTIDVDLTVLNQSGSAVAFGGAIDIADWVGEAGQGYYVVLASKGTAGPYTIEFRERRPPVDELYSVDDHPNAVPQGTLVSAPVIGTPVDLNGVLTNTSDVDVFRFVSGSTGLYDAWIISPPTLSISVVDADGDPPSSVYTGTNFVTWNTEPGLSWYIVVSGTAAGRYRVQLWVPPT